MLKWQNCKKHAIWSSFYHRLPKCPHNYAVHLKVVTNNIKCKVTKYLFKFILFIQQMHIEKVFNKTMPPYNLEIVYYVPCFNTSFELIQWSWAAGGAAARGPALPVAHKHAHAPFLVVVARQQRRKGGWANAQRPTPNGQLATASGQRPTANGQCPTANCQLQLPAGRRRSTWPSRPWRCTPTPTTYGSA